MSLISSREIPKYLSVMDVELWYNIEDNLIRYSSLCPLFSQMNLEPDFLELWVEMFLFLIFSILPPSFNSQKNDKITHVAESVATTPYFSQFRHVWIRRI